MKPIYTAGYMGWPVKELYTKVVELDAILVDIRYTPYSQIKDWRQQNLQDLFQTRYTYMHGLGNKNYQDGTIRLADPMRTIRPIQQILEQRPVVLLCGCRNHETCHRLQAAQFLAEQLNAPVEHMPAFYDRVPPPGYEKAITLTAPYGSLIAASAIISNGKHYETRDWPTSYRGPILIHQAKGLADGNEVDLRALCSQVPFRNALHALGYRTTKDIPRGHIVARAELVAVHQTENIRSMLSATERTFGNFSKGRYAWQLENIEAISVESTTLQVAGKQWLWEYQIASACGL